MLHIEKAPHVTAVTRGFAAQTRELATRLDISEPLIYRYFQSKEALIERVYEDTILSRWNPEWEVALASREVPLQARLVEFYLSYLRAIDDPVWVRIVMWSSLDGLDLTRGYILAHVGRVLAIISDEVQRVVRRPVDREVLWHLQSTFIYYLIRKHIRRTPVADELTEVVPAIIDNFLQGFCLDEP